MAFTLKPQEEAQLMARIRVVMSQLGDAWDPMENGPERDDQVISKNLLKECSGLSIELNRFV